MKKWIRFIFLSNERLDRLCEKLDKKIDDVALNMGERAKSMADRVVRLNAKKAALINLRVIHNRIMDVLSSEERVYACNVLTAKQGGQIATDLAALVDKQAAVRDGEIERRIFAKAERVLYTLGYTDERLKTDCSVLAPVISF